MDADGCLFGHRDFFQRKRRIRSVCNRWRLDADGDLVIILGGRGAAGALWAHGRACPEAKPFGSRIAEVPRPLASPARYALARIPDFRHKCGNDIELCRTMPPLAKQQVNGLAYG
jgi:hypothetical protein